VTRPRILIADDHEPTRADVRAAIEQDGRLEVCAEAADAVAAVDAAMRERPDLCLLDVRMPGGGLAAAWEITARLPQTKVVMLTVSADDDDLFAALRAGASGYLLKDVPPARLLPALIEALEGEAAIPRSLVSRLVATFHDPAPRRRTLLAAEQASGLTSREWQVLDLLRRGLSTAEIADRLFVSRATVRSHIAAVLRKLRVPDRESAIRLLEGD
jgi:DNA-binding NarL/FixJ family response regulator